MIKHNETSKWINDIKLTSMDEDEEMYFLNEYVRPAYENINRGCF